MKKIFVRKIFPYDPTVGGKYSKYEGYGLITSERKSVGIEKELPVKIDKVKSPIFCSPLKRGKETAKSVSRQLGVKKTSSLNEIREISFNLSKLVSKSEYERFGSNLVRKRFIDAFMEDNLLESRAKIKKRITKLLDRLERLPAGNHVLISHSFFMKILQIYLKNSELFSQPQILRKKFDYRKKTFEFGKGFDFELS